MLCGIVEHKKTTTMNIEALKSYEDKLIQQSATELLHYDNPFAQVSDDVVANLNAALPRIALDVHRRLLLDLVYTFVCSRFPNEVEAVMWICFECDPNKCNLVNGYDIETIPVICEELHIAFLNSKFSLVKGKKIRKKSKEQLVERGAIYTRLHIAQSIVNDTLTNITIPLNSAKILDFACGTGRFYESIVNHFSSPTIAILNNVYAIDIDSNALLVTRLKAISYFGTITESDCQTIKTHIILKDGLKMNSMFQDEARCLSPEDFDGLVEAGFDIIVSNPPYLVLKPNRSKTCMASADKIQEQVNYFRSCGRYVFSIEGMLNLYQLSIERMLQMLKSGGILGVICPSTLFGDVSVSKLRKHLLLCNEVISIAFYAEKEQMFENVTQATNIFILKKGGHTSNIAILEDGVVFNVDFLLVKELFPDNLEIPAINAIEWNILRKLSSLKKLKQISTVRNKRGELDLTLCKQYITTTRTPYRLVRGNMIGSRGIKDVNGEYVVEGFILTRSTDYLTFDFKKSRLVCQQVSNAGQKKRLRFVYCSDCDILGNSCNYISADEETLAKMYILLNSSVLNWRFKITSSNNHINNYELDELPIVDLSRVDNGLSFSTQEELDDYVCALYGLSKEEQNIVSA